jgi:hypothetical protein
MVYRKGELSSTMLDRQYPYQVALPTETVQAQYFAIHQIGDNLGKAPRGHSVRHADKSYAVYCFADQASADQFREHFNGEPFDPADRGRGRRWYDWNKPEG